MRKRKGRRENLVALRSDGEQEDKICELWYKGRGGSTSSSRAVRGCWRNRKERSRNLESSRTNTTSIWLLGYGYRVCQTVKDMQSAQYA